MQSNITFDSKFIFVCISFSPCVVCFALLCKCTMPLLSWDARIARRHKTEKKLVHICRNMDKPMACWRRRRRRTRIKNDGREKRCNEPYTKP